MRATGSIRAVVAAAGLIAAGTVPAAVPGAAPAPGTPRAGAAPGDQVLRLRADRIEASQWAAEQITATMRLAADGTLSATLRVGSLTLPAPLDVWHGIEVHCPALALSDTALACRDARLRIGESPLEAVPFPVTASFDRRGRHLEFRSGALPWRGMRLALSGFWHPEGWGAHFTGQSLDAAGLHRQLAGLAAPLAALDVGSGSGSIEARVTGGAGHPLSLTADMTVTGLALGNASGTLAAEGLDAHARLELTTPGAPQPWPWHLELDLERGEAYVEPVYLDLSGAGVGVVADGALDRAGARLEVTHLDYRHRETLEADLSATVALRDGPRIERMTAELRALRLPGGYRSYLQGLLVGSPLARLETAGRASGHLAMRDGRLQDLTLALETLSLDDRDRRLALYGLEGRLHWRRTAGDGGTAPSTLAWDGGFLYGIGFGSGATALQLQSQGFSLPEGLRLPLLDGALVVDTFEANALGGADPVVTFDARLEPIGLRALTAALNWPPFPGTLSGELPMLSLREGVVTLGGSLVARVFGGTVQISDLRIEEPFGANRSSSFNVVLDGLDLGQLTDVFPLGHIEGRLDGRIEGLRTLKGRPVAFDASFHTPPGDDSRHRISRRAIDNLTEIAGAGTAVLSGGFLSLFREFGYQGLGISCRLEGDRCRMDGYAPTDGGYYLVKGAGLPRINVVGYAREVNWPRLVAQIESALEAGDVTTSLSGGNRSETDR